MGNGLVTVEPIWRVDVRVTIEDGKRGKTIKKHHIWYGLRKLQEKEVGLFSFNGGVVSKQALAELEWMVKTFRDFVKWAEENGQTHLVRE